MKTSILNTALIVAVILAALVLAPTARVGTSFHDDGGIASVYTPHPEEPGRFVGAKVDFREDGSLQAVWFFESDGAIRIGHHFDREGNLLSIERPVGTSGAPLHPFAGLPDDTLAVNSAGEDL
jgi:hypothetical protein